MLCHYFPHVRGLVWVATFFSVPSVNPFVGGNAAGGVFVRFCCGPEDGTEANLAPCQRSGVSIARLTQANGNVSHGNVSPFAPFLGATEATINQSVGESARYLASALTSPGALQDRS